ncbi:hypothetical protein [Pedobacter sp. Leaf176]|uniref:hypothetical protein n=1 Tax=Pedobacter sp. Leaf176 TaxID=1736286 RepID=UPI0006F1FB3E|nr:hypothetical protein [Pedobacter sp. Leaf176]KQR70265.1 hypothetical protein ASF92_09725 [Pedobacter sp. Leaf176]
MKNKFIENELWYLSLAGAFQRNNVYAENIDDNNGKKKESFKKKLKEHVLKITDRYHVFVSDENHVSNILEIIALNADDILKVGKLTFGTAQKLLNLYLKYMWCTERLAHIPPHCPVDSIILGNSKNYKYDSWTKLKCETKYMLYINDLRELATQDNLHLAEWELGVFNRRAEKKLV